jgi:hypothetical protein
LDEDIHLQLEAQRRRVALEVAEERSRTRRLYVLGVLAIAIVLAVLLLIADGF